MGLGILILSLLKKKYLFEKQNFIKKKNRKWEINKFTSTQFLLERKKKEKVTFIDTQDTPIALLIVLMVRKLFKEYFYKPSTDSRTIGF